MNPQILVTYATKHGATAEITEKTGLLTMPDSCLLAVSYSHDCQLKTTYR